MEFYRRCWIVVFLLLSFSSVFGQLKNTVSMDSDSYRTGELWLLMMGNEHWTSANRSTSNQEKQISGRKSPVVGILLSVAVPGAGEFYAGSWLKGAVLLGAEVALWYGYWKFSNRGQEFEDEFHDYADTHWSEDLWQENKTGHDPSTHTLPDTKTQQYYEMIGKYDQFRAGWDDYVEGGLSLTPNRDYYEGLRDDSNTQFKRASTCFMLSMGNRLLSVFDTGFTIRRINRRVEGKVRMSMKHVGNEWTPCLALRMNW